MVVNRKEENFSSPRFMGDFQVVHNCVLYKSKEERVALWLNCQNTINRDNSRSADLYIHDIWLWNMDHESLSSRIYARILQYFVHISRRDPLENSHCSRQSRRHQSKRKINERKVRPNKKLLNNCIACKNANEKNARRRLFFNYCPCFSFFFLF